MQIVRALLVVLHNTIIFLCMLSLTDELSETLVVCNHYELKVLLPFPVLHYSAENYGIVVPNICWLQLQRPFFFFDNKKNRGFHYSSISRAVALIPRTGQRRQQVLLRTQARNQEWIFFHLFFIFLCVY